jgi:hypothetical protein
MGFFKKFKKAIGGSVIGGVLGFATGGIAGAVIGGLTGGAGGYMQDRMDMAQKEANEAQLAAAQKIADAMQPAAVANSITPTAEKENAQAAEEAAASEASRRYSLSKALYKRRTSKLGATSGSTGAKKTLG